MSLKTARFLLPAQEEFIAEVDYYRQINPVLAQRFVDAVEHATLLAVLFAEAGSPAIAGCRQIQLKNFPFSLVYHATSHELVVIALAHHARKPGYWRHRS